MRILICDDDAALAQRTAGEVRRLAGDLPVEITAVTDGADLPEGGDLYILDIALPGENGMELARAIRRREPGAIIIFLTAYERYVFEAFQVAALRYVRKDRLDMELPEALSAAFRQFARQNAFHVFRTPGGQARIPLDTVAYIEKVGRAVFLHRADGPVLKVHGPVSHLAAALVPAGFVQPNSGSLVNPAHIGGFDGEAVTLTCGVRLPVSRTRKKNVRQAISAYWKEAL